MNAYDLYLQGLKDLNLNTFESLRRAEKLFEQSLAIDANYLPTRLALVRTWIDMAGTGAMPAPEAVKNANPVLEEILRAEPGNSTALHSLGQVHLLNRDRKAARQSFEQALAANPRDAAGLKEYGSLLFNTRATEEALSYLRQAVSIEPYDVQMQWQLCAAYAFMGDEAEASRECNRIGDIQPGNPMQFYGQGFLYQTKGELANYIYWNSKAMELDPGDPELKTGIAQAWIDLGDMQQAEQWLQEAAKLAPDHPTSVSTRIQVLLQKEQFQQALELAQKAHDEHLPDRQGSDGTIYGLLVGDAVHRRDFDLALELLQGRMPTGVTSPLELDEPDDVFLLARMAQVMKMQDPASEQAAALLDHAAALNRQGDNRNIPFSAGFRQATIEAARGNKPGAIAGLQAAFDAGWRIDWQSVLRDDWQFEPLHNEPDYKNLVAVLEKDMEKQREEAYELLGLKK
jgi:tetratricopeptide (TPR) repeat protein